MFLLVAHPIGSIKLIAHNPLGVSYELEPC